MNSDVYIRIISAIVAIIFLIVNIAKYFIKLASEKREKEKHYYENKMQLLDSYKATMREKLYEKLKCEIKFQAACGVSFSNEIIVNIWKARKPKEILDNIEIAGHKLRENDQEQTIGYHYCKCEKWFNYVAAIIGLTAILLGFLILNSHDDLNEFAIFLLLIVGGCGIIIPAILEINRYQAADKVIQAYEEIIKNKK